MSPETMIGLLDRQLDRHGEWITLQRLVADGEGNQTVSAEARVRAFVRANQPQALGESDAANTKAKLSPTDLAREAWPGVPERDDRVNFQGGRKANIALVSPVYADGVLVRVDLEWRE